MANKRYRAKAWFSTVITVGGEEFVQVWEEGDERDLEPIVFECLQRDVPGILSEVKAPKVAKPKAEKPKVATKAGPLTDSATRQVTDAPKRTKAGKK